MKFFSRNSPGKKKKKPEVFDRHVLVIYLEKEVPLGTYAA